APWPLIWSRLAWGPARGGQIPAGAPHGRYDGSWTRPPHTPQRSSTSQTQFGHHQDHALAVEELEAPQGVADEFRPRRIEGAKIRLGQFEQGRLVDHVQPLSRIVVGAVFQELFEERLGLGYDPDIVIGQLRKGRDVLDGDGRAIPRGRSPRTRKLART